MTDLVSVPIATSAGMEYRPGIPTEHPRLFVVDMADLYCSLTHAPTGRAVIRLRCPSPWDRARQVQMLARLAGKIHAAGFALEFTTAEEAKSATDGEGIKRLLDRETKRWKSVVRAGVGA